MSKSRADAQNVLASAFTAYHGEVEPEEFLASVVSCVADEIELLAAALESDEECRGAAVRCLRRAADRLRLALQFPATASIAKLSPDAGDEDQEDDSKSPVGTKAAGT